MTNKIKQIWWLTHGIADSESTKFLDCIAREISNLVKKGGDCLIPKS